MAMITRMTDTDFYKLTMGQAVLHRFPEAHAVYAFKCRTPEVELGRFAEAIQDEIDAMANLALTSTEDRALRGYRFLTDDYVDWLNSYRFDPDEVTLSAQADGTLDVRVQGPWARTIYWEVPLLAIIQEVAMRHRAPNPDWAGARQALEDKIALVNERDPEGNFCFADFGTRRRFSGAWQAEVVARTAQALPERFVGTSNVAFAIDNNIPAIGTMAHEYLQAAQALAPDLRHFQAYALEHWMQEFRGDLGIALTDVIGMNAFLDDFDRLFAKAYDGLRHDSGDPIAWGEAAIRHYQEHGIDPRTRTLIFSDSLDFPTALDILSHFKGRIRVSFGIGTNLTHDIPGVTPLNSVMKLVELNGQPVAKLSDAPGKTMCEDAEYVQRLRHLFEQPAVAAS